MVLKNILKSFSSRFNIRRNRRQSKHLPKPSNLELPKVGKVIEKPKEPFMIKTAPNKPVEIKQIPTSKKNENQLKLKPSSPVIKTYPYKLKKLDEALMLITYKDEAGNSLTSPLVIPGYLGAQFKLKFKNFPTYNLVKIEGYTSLFVDRYGIITLTYRKISAANIWIFCQDIDDHHFLEKPSFISGQLDDSYELTSPEISGYTLLRAEGEFRGTFSLNQKVVIYYYRRSSFKEIDYLIRFLRMKDYITCLDDPNGKKTSVTLAKGTIWQTFQTVYLSDGAVWFCLGGNIWIKQDNRLEILNTKPHRKKILTPTEAELPFSIKLNHKAQIDFVPNKSITLYNRPFGEAVSKISNGTIVTLTGRIGISHMQWFEVEEKGWTIRQYLNLDPKLEKA